MFNLIFGTIWTLFVTPIFIMCLVVPGEQRGGVDMSLGLFMFFILFEAIGLFLLISGIKKVKKDKKTNKLGEITYGQIISIYGTGSSVNGKEELQAEIQTYLPNENIIKKINEIIGFPPIYYNVGDFVQLKYYEGDINVVQVVSENAIPNTILVLLKEETKKENTIIVNGEVFIKEQTENNNDKFN